MDTVATHTAQVAHAEAIELVHWEDGRSGWDSGETRDLGDHQFTGIENLVLV